MRAEDVPSSVDLVQLAAVTAAAVSSRATTIRRSITPEGQAHLTLRPRTAFRASEIRGRRLPVAGCLTRFRREPM
jgi:hypothetical protein